KQSKNNPRDPASRSTPVRDLSVGQRGYKNPTPFFRIAIAHLHKFVCEETNPSSHHRALDTWGTHNQDPEARIQVEMKARKCYRSLQASQQTALTWLKRVLEIARSFWQANVLRFQASRGCEHRSKHRQADDAQRWHNTLRWWRATEVGAVVP